MRNKTEVALDEFIRELASTTRGGAGQTATEMQRQTGKSLKKIMAALREAKERGRLVVGRKLIVNLSGAPQSVPTYTITKAKR